MEICNAQESAMGIAWGKQIQVVFSTSITIVAYYYSSLIGNHKTTILHMNLAKKKKKTLPFF